MKNTNMTIALPSGEPMALAEGTFVSQRLNSRGKSLGIRVSFTGSKSARDLKDEGKAKGLKGKALERFVNALLKGDVATAAWTRHGVLMEGLRANGAVPVELDGNKAGPSYKATYKVVTDEEAEKEATAKLLAEKDAEIARLTALAGVRGLLAK